MAQEIPTGEGLTFEKVWLLFQESDRRLEKTDRQINALREAVEKTEAQVEKTSQRVDQTSRELGRLGNKLGEFVEGMVRPGLVRLFNERGIPIGQTAQHLRAQHGGEGMEVNLVGINGDEVVIAEV